MDATSLYWFGALGFVVASIVIGMATGILRRRSRMKTIPSNASDGWQLLQIQSRRQRYLAGLYIFCTTGLPLIGLSAHWYSRQELNGGGRAFVILSAVLASAEVIWLIRSFLDYRYTGDARVQLSCATPLKRDDDFTLRINIPARDAAPAEIVGRIVCIEHAVVHFGRFTHMKHTTVREIPLNLAAARSADGRLAGEIRVRIPAENCPPSGRGKSFNHTYEWQLRVDLAGGKNAQSVFPLDVM